MKNVFQDELDFLRVAFSKSTQRKRLVSASSVGIRKLWSLPCVVNTSDRIILVFTTLS